MIFTLVCTVRSQSCQYCVLCVLLIRCSLGPGPGCALPAVLFSSRKFKFLPADCQVLPQEYKVMTEKLFDPYQSSSPLWRLIASDYQVTSGLATKCLKCERPGKLRCGGCQEAAYCSKECQRQDWPRHRPQCRPFRIVTSPGVGRHLVATRDIGPGEIILEEAPITGGEATGSMRSEVAAAGCAALPEEGRGCPALSASRRK